MTGCTHRAKSGTKVALACLGCDQMCHTMTRLWWLVRVEARRYKQCTRGVVGGSANVQVVDSWPAMRQNGYFPKNNILYSNTIPGTRQRNNLVWDSMFRGGSSTGRRLDLLKP